MIDHIAMKHVKNYYLRVAIVILWNILGMVLMWEIMFTNNPNEYMAITVAVGMFLAGLYALGYKSNVRRENEVYEETS